MSEYGISFVVFDWYWEGKGVGRPHLDHTLNSFREIASTSGVDIDYSLLWANNPQSPTSLEQFDAIVRSWVDGPMQDGQFLRRFNKPVVFVLSPQGLERNAKLLQLTTSQLLSRAREMARKSGLDGIFFVAASDALEERVLLIEASGYDAISAYNYHRGFSGKADSRGTSTSYNELVLGYEEQWRWMFSNSRLPYIIPITAGWDKRPWQAPGSVDDHNRSFADPDGFRSHLLQARKMAESNPTLSLRTLVVCCWNEYGEGSYIEPTKKFGFSLLDAIRSVFGKE